MTTVDIKPLRRSMEGIVAAVLTTCDAEGMPNVSMISQVHFVDNDHVALSYQFFNKTRRNVLATHKASVMITDPVTLVTHRLALHFIETQSKGPVFETMRAKLAGIASHHGMDGVFRLLGADIYRVTAVQEVECWQLLPEPPVHQLLANLRACQEALASCDDLEDLLETALAGLERHFGIRYAMVLMAEADVDRLYTVASRGYAHSGIGSEVAFGEGVIGVAAREKAPIRIGHMTMEYRYGAAMVHTARRAGILSGVPTEIPFPGLKNPRSQIALPILLKGELLGILFAEAEETMRFGYDEEDALMLLAGHLGLLASMLKEESIAAETSDGPHLVEPDGVVTVRYHAPDQSVFIGHDYLIKGVAGAILWRVLGEFRDTGRTEFTTRELRIDPALRLPEHAENLDARLILLRKRLEERQACLRIEKSGRGRFRLVAHCRLKLENLTAAQALSAE